jgi:hypothetical protein
MNNTAIHVGAYSLLIGAVVAIVMDRQGYIELLHVTELRGIEQRLACTVANSERYLEESDTTTGGRQ